MGVCYGCRYPHIGHVHQGYIWFGSIFDSRNYICVRHIPGYLDILDSRYDLLEVSNFITIQLCGQVWRPSELLRFLFGFHETVRMLCTGRGCVSYHDSRWPTCHSGHSPRLTVATVRSFSTPWNPTHWDRYVRPHLCVLRQHAALGHLDLPERTSDSQSSSAV